MRAYTIKRAKVSPSGRYRDTLTRTWRDDSFAAFPEAERVLFVMLNPSKADGTKDDPTIRKCAGFTERWGYAGFNVVNLFAWRATKPIDLWASYNDIVGPYNTYYIDRELQRPSTKLVVAAWGGSIRAPQARDRAPAQAELMLECITRAGHTPMCIGKTGVGDPRHPLMQAYDTPLEEM